MHPELLDRAFQSLGEVGDHRAAVARADLTGQVDRIAEHDLGPPPGDPSERPSLSFSLSVSSISPHRTMRSCSAAPAAIGVGG